ncbi:hypothetical protein UUU_11500 [Klebsiella pneumoniae subsp. pneumoniae DSM 30104 = JCM 1662 = NBRC 14940]|nr:hypothetical protein UUU_11500 [Klebsiella pneumoniae subsp. pneumoniae DSM 30104 = JCM 1662 = NBRC 14940]
MRFRGVRQIDFHALRNDRRRCHKDQQQHQQDIQQRNDVDLGLQFATSASTCSGHGLPLIAFAGGKGLTVQNSGELFHKVVVIQFKLVHALVQAVIRHDRRDRGEQTNRGGDQRFGDTWRHHLQGGLLHRAKGDKGVHNPPDGTEQTDIRADRAYGAEERNMGFQRFQFAVHRNTHRARCPFDNRFRRMAVSPMQACKLFETAVEDLFRTGQVIATPLALLVQTRELDPGPEFVLERFSFTRGRVKDTRSLNNDSPGSDRKTNQNQHDKFYQKARLQEQIKDIHVSHCLNSATIDLGSARGFIKSGSTHTMRTSASFNTVFSALTIRCVKTKEVPRIEVISVWTSSMSSSLAGAKYSSVILRTTKATRSANSTC